MVHIYIYMCVCVCVNVCVLCCVESMFDFRHIIVEPAMLAQHMPTAMETRIAKVHLSEVRGVVRKQACARLFDCC
jgi:hypothetical protein